MMRLARYCLLMVILNLHPPERVAAQDINNFTQFYFNPSLLNPSFTGSDGQPALYIAYKKQWAGLDGSPAIANANLQTSINERTSLGFTLNNSSFGQLNSTALLFTGAYLVPLGNHQSLRFGLSAGVSSTKVDVNALTFATPNDPVLASLAKNSFQLIGNFGMSYHSETFHIGVALPNLFEPAYINQSSFSVSKIAAFESVVVHASNRFYLAKGKHVFEPYVVYRLNSNVPSQFEFAGVFHIQHIVYVGATYKQDFGVSGLAGFKLNAQTALGYSYTLQASGTNEINRPSHEIQFAYLFGKRKKDAPVYSFVNTEKDKIVKKTPQQIAAEKKKQQQELAKKTQEEKLKAQKELEAKKAHDAEVAKQAELARLAAEKAKAPADTTVHGLTHEEQMAAEEDRLKRLETHANNPTEVHNEEIHPHSERHEIVKRGGHAKELEIGDYVIAGVFKQEVNAKRYADGLLKLGFKDTDYGFLTAHNLWYVHISEHNDIEAARKFRDQFRQMKIFREAWLLTIQQ